MGDYARKTACLTLAERGAYDALLDEYYITERPLPSDKQELYRIVRAVERWERAAVDRVLAKFFTSTDAGYHNPRAEEELAKYKKAADVSRANGSRHAPDGQPDRLPDRVQNLRTTELQKESKPNSKALGAKPAPFTPPKIEEVRDFMASKGFSEPDLEAGKFWRHFENCNWRLSSGRGSRMKDWKLSVQNWHARKFGESNGTGKSDHVARTQRTLEAAARLLENIGEGTLEIGLALPPGNH